MSYPNVSRMTGTRLELSLSVACHHSSNKIVGCLSTTIQILANDATSDCPTFRVYKIRIFFNNRRITRARKGWATRGGLGAFSRVKFCRNLDPLKCHFQCSKRKIFVENVCQIDCRFMLIFFAWLPVQVLDIFYILYGF